jgi:hypothetical protein
MGSTDAARRAGSQAATPAAAATSATTPMSVAGSCGAVSKRKLVMSRVGMDRSSENGRDAVGLEEAFRGFRNGHALRRAGIDDERRGSAEAGRCCSCASYLECLN